jgi:predicted RNA binding protein YcfA (HicA-like mRNA interferase family)
LSQIPVLNYDKVVKSLQKNGFYFVRQKGSHIRMQKKTSEKTIKVTVPAHKPIKKNTLRQLIKQSELDLDDFLKYV